MWAGHPPPNFKNCQFFGGEILYIDRLVGTNFSMIAGNIFYENTVESA